MKAGLALALFGVCGISIAVASGTASPVVYGLGEATPGVTATGIVSALTALLSGSGGIWALLKSLAPQAGNVIDVLKPVIENRQVIDSGKDVVETLLGGRFDPLELSEQAALLFVQLERSKADDKEGADLAFQLMQHVKAQGGKAAQKK